MATDADNFNRVISALAGTTSSGGNVWVLHGSYAGNMVGAASDTEIRGTGSINDLNYSGATPASADYATQAKLSNNPAGAVTIGICGRVSTLVDSREWFFWHGGNARWELREIIAGVSSTLATASTNSPEGATPTAKLDCTGLTATAYSDATQILTASILIGGAGRGGLIGGDSTSARADDFLTTEAAVGQPFYLLDQKPYPSFSAVSGYAR